MGNELKTDVHVDLPSVQTAYGVDVSDRFVSVARVARTRSGLRYETLLSVTTTDPVREMLPVLRELQGDFSEGRGVMVAALPVSAGSTRWLTAPFASTAKARRVLPALLDIELPLPLESCVSGFLDLHVVDGKTEALAIAAPRTTIEKRLTQLQEWKIDPHVLDHEGLALWKHHCRLRPGTVKGLHVLVYLGVDRTVWCAGEGEMFLTAQANQIGRERLSSDDSAAEAWCDRGLRFLRSCPGTAASQSIPVHWVGPGAADKSLLTNLQAGLMDLPVAHYLHEQPDVFLASALAANLVTGGQDSINFRTGADAHPVVLQLRRRCFRRMAIAMVAAAFVLAVLNLAVVWGIQSRFAAADARIGLLAREITGLSNLPRRQEVILAQRSMEAKAEALEPIRAHFEAPVGMDLNGVLANAKENDWIIQSLQLTPRTVQIRGSAPSQSLIRSFEASLRQSGWTVESRIQSGIDPSRLDVQISGGRAP